MLSKDVARQIGISEFKADWDKRILEMTSTEFGLLVIQRVQYCSSYFQLAVQRHG